MRIPAHCPRCREVDERRRSMYEVSSGQRSSEIEVIDLHEIDAADVHSGKLTLRCKQGHTTEVKLPVPEFELLFDLGCSALLDGYPREAVTSFAASFERFEEITCRFLFGRRHLSFERVDHWWKEVATSSERQKGSFVALWIASFFEEPPTLPRKLIELRNDCVHKGRIPRESEAKAYGEAGRRHHRHGAGRAGRARRLHAPDLSRRARHCRHALPQAAYDTRTAFAPVGLITEAPMTIIGRSDLASDSLSELVAWLRQRGTKATFGNAGIGSAAHLCGMLLASQLDVHPTTVPYRGTGPVMNDLVGKQIDISCDQATNTTGAIRGGQVKAYAVTTRARLPSLPSLPTAEEAGLKGFELAVWHGMFAPAGTPLPIVARLAAALATALKDPGLVRRASTKISTTPMPADKATPEAAQAMLVGEIDRWAPIIKAAGEYAD